MAAGQDPDSKSIHPDAASEKRIIRQAVRARRRERQANSSSAARLAAGMRTSHHLAQHPAIATAKCIATYEPLPTEEDVSALPGLLGPGIRFLVPITLDDLDLSWRDVSTGQDLGTSALAQADVVITPALAIGPKGQRLGQGGGSYDRALPRRSAGVPVIAVVFPDEVGISFPSEAHDKPVDAVVTREGLTTFSQSTPGA